MLIRLVRYAIMIQILTTVVLRVRSIPLDENFRRLVAQYIDYERGELKDTFGVEDSSKVPEHDLVWPKAKYTIDEQGHPILNRLLIDNDQNADRSFEIPLQLVDDPMDSASVRKKCHYRTTGESGGVQAAVSDCDGQLRGTIITDTAVFTLHPLPKPRQKFGPKFNISSSTSEHSQFQTHVLVKRQSLLQSEDASQKTEFCGLDADRAVSSDVARDSPLSDAPSAGHARRIAAESTMSVEMAIFVDYEMYKRYWSEFGNDAETRLQDFVSTVFNNIQILYNHPTMSYQMSFKIVRYEVFKTQPDALSGSRHREGDAQMYLDSFCMHQYGMRGRTWDQAFLFTGYDIHRSYGSDKSISGIARLYGACDPYNSCVLVEGHDFTSVYIATHEMGHGFGMRHDEPYCSSTFIMSGSLGPGKVTWSTCSISDMGKYISKLDNNGKNCLRQTNGYAAMSIDMSSLPGQKYDADRQCAMMHGAGYRHVIPRNQYAEGACSMMWCGQNAYGRIITAHPALEGSVCGESRYCLRGQCLAWISVASPRQSPPRPLDGVWTDWFRPSCADCICAPFTGGLGVLQSTRTCTNPPPSNGGRECPGDAVRGVVCNADCPIRMDSVEAYVERQCQWRMTQGKDPDMTGRGAQLGKDLDRACKVFCDIRPTSSGKNYRFYGDLIPDGSPCAVGRYCVAGQCLQLACDGDGLVNDQASCPASTERCTFARPTPPKISPTQAVISTSSVSNPIDRDWTAWSSWSICSVTCGHGRSTRRRQCPPGGKCELNGTGGNTVETKDCDMPKCVTTSSGSVSAWTDWSSWSRCSTTCEKGVQTRNRRCLSGGCSEASADRRICDNGPCDNRLRPSDDTRWTTWSVWTTCSVTCGEGTQTRSRACSGRCGANSFEKSRESRPCYESSCARWGSWGAWSECYSSSATQTRVRQCYGGGRGRCPRQSNDSPTDSQSRSCQKSSSSLTPQGANGGGGSQWAKWYSWSEWSPCTRSCGSGGTRIRYRTCAGERKGACSGEDNERELCATHECSNVRLGRGTGGGSNSGSTNWLAARLSRPRL